MNNNRSASQNQDQAKGLTAIAKAIRNHTSAYQQNPEHEPRQKPRLKRWISAITLISALVAVGINLRLLHTSQQQLVVTNRAYVVARHAKIFSANVTGGTQPILSKGSEQGAVGQLRAGDIPWFEVVIVNSGNTPAFDVRVFSNVGIGPSFPAEDYRFDPAKNLDGLQTTVTLAKDATETISEHFLPLKPEDITAIMKGGENLAQADAYLLFWGLISYTDVFSTEQTSRFCFFYNRRSYDMVGCPTHNS